MGVIILFFSCIAVIIVWWLSKQRLGAKPWLELGVDPDGVGSRASSAPLATVGLAVLLVSIASLFALFISAYLMRMQLADWRPTPKPTLLWINTGMLMASSAALQWARTVAEREDASRLRTALWSAAGAAALFVLGQLYAWSQLSGAGFGLTSGPASSFFYLITALHGLHVLGGIVALGRVLHRANRGAGPAQIRLSVDLCSTYWDFLLLMWIILFGLLLLS